jgi:hypothetical protein
VTTVKTDPKLLASFFLSKKDIYNYFSSRKQCLMPPRSNCQMGKYK